MKHLMTVFDIKHLDEENNVIWEQKEAKNIVHASGQYFCLTSLFNTLTTQIPANYYAGLDNRATVVDSDTFSTLSQEPSQFGYTRQVISSANGFVVALNNAGIYQAVSNVLTFIATGGTWGPVQNIFLASSADSSGYLISTAALDGAHFVTDGQKLTIRISLTLQDV